VEDVVLLAELAVSHELLVEPAERRAGVAGHHRAGVQAAAAVGAVLVEHEADEPLDAGQEHPALLEQVLVVERHVAQRALGGAPGGEARAALAAPLPLAALLVPDSGRRRHSVSLRSIGKRTLPYVV
jgi:hypothetical protein